MSEWQPIETAPGKPQKIIVIGGRYATAEIVLSDGAWWRLNVKAGLQKEYGLPTHWMPLPPPPTEQTSDSNRPHLENGAGNVEKI